jgi:hypothetical protein
MRKCISLHGADSGQGYAFPVECTDCIVYEETPISGADRGQGYAFLVLIQAAIHSLIIMRMQL